MRMSSLPTAFAACWQAARVRHVAIRELAAMSARELGDMGITRLDVSRLFEPHLMPTGGSVDSSNASAGWYRAPGWPAAVRQTKTHTNGHSL
jgi:uncharacterized protein YjiS (DUF1127 family)